MNKHDLIKEINKEKYDFSKPETSLDSSDYKEGYNDASDDILDIVKKLDEPQKVKVPDEFDTWYKEIKTRWVNESSARHFALWKICQYGFGCGFEDVNGNRTSNTLSDWVSDHKEDAINAVWNGYEVEEEPKYRVLFPCDKRKTGHQFSYLIEDGRQCYCSDLETIPELTESTIKSIDERYWPFAVPVEKV